MDSAVTPIAQKEPRRFPLTVGVLAVSISLSIPILSIVFLFAMAFNDTGASMYSVLSIPALFSLTLLPFVLSAVAAALFVDLRMKGSGRYIKKTAAFLGVGFVCFIITGVICVSVIEVIAPR